MKLLNSWLAFLLLSGAKCLIYPGSLSTKDGIPATRVVASLVIMDPHHGLKVLLVPFVQPLLWGVYLPAMA